MPRELLEALAVMTHVKDIPKMVEVMTKYKPDDEVAGFEEFKDVVAMFGLDEVCAAELWERMGEAKKIADEKVEGGVLFTYKCAISSIALSLSTGKCKDCEHNPSAWKKEGDSGGYTIQ